MALSKVINDLADLNQSGSTNALKGCVGTTAQQPASSSVVYYLLVAGGGGGGGYGQAGGGGGGGYISGSTTVYQGIPAMLTVGEGGVGGYSTSNTADSAAGRNGEDSGFNGLRAIGGGAGSGPGGYTSPGRDGGSGGGGGTIGGPGLSLNNQGNNAGAEGSYSSPYWGAGGGGAGGVGGDGGGAGTGVGGVGWNINTFINSTNAALAGIGEIPSATTNVWVAGGAGAGSWDSATGAAGGLGGGADSPASAGGSLSKIDGLNGTSNTGGGGSGASAYSDASVGYSTGGTGGSGVAILKYDNTEITGYTLNSEDTYTVNWPADKYGVAYWPLNLDVKDVGGYYDGTATDVTYVTGKFNQAASFNGSSSLIEASDPNAGGGARTFSAWIKTTSGSFQGIITNGGTSHASGLNMFVYNDKLYSTSGNGTSGENYGPTSSASINTGEWVHCVLTLSGTTIGSTIKAYINGALDGTHTTTVTITDTYDDFRIGGRYINGSNVAYFEGEIEQVRIYGSELSITDVQDIYNNSKPGSLPPLSSTAPTIDSLSFPSGTTTAALWDFNGDLIADPTTYNGSITSAISYATGKFTTEALYFNGLGGGLISTNYTRSGSNFTVSLWVNLLDRSGRELFLGDGNSGGSDTSISISMQITYPGDVLKVYINSADGVTTGASVTTSVDWNTYWGKWTHVAVTQNGGDVKVYVNGILVDTLTVSGSQILSGAAAQAIALGSWGPAASNNGETKGSINLMRFYNATLTDQNIYDLWQKETNIQTHFTSGTDDTLVFKSGSGQIRFHNDGPPGAEIGMVRTNTDLSSANSTSGMEHFNIGGWKDFTNCTNSVCSYPVSGSALYQFNDNSHDTCGNYNGAGGSNITYVPSGNFGKAANFPGNLSTAGDAIELPSSLSTLLSNDYSISIWFNADDFATGCVSGCGNYPTLITCFDNLQFVYCVHNPSGDYVLAFYDYNTSAYLYGSTTLSTGTWYHTVLTKSSTDGVKIYLDGVLEASNSGMTANTPTGNTGKNLIGMYKSTSANPYDLPWNGLMDQIRIYNSVLTPAQVTQVYNEIYCP